MSLYAFTGALETGLAFALVALGAYLTFKVLDFPDLTVEGSFPLGASVAAKLMVSGVDPWTANYTVRRHLADRVHVFNLKLRIRTYFAGLTAIASRHSQQRLGHRAHQHDNGLPDPAPGVILSRQWCLAISVSLRRSHRSSARCRPSLPGCAPIPHGAANGSSAHDRHRLGIAGLTAMTARCRAVLVPGRFSWCRACRCARW